MNILMKCIQLPATATGSHSTSQSLQPFQFDNNFAGTIMSLITASNISSHIWVLETSATNHMCCNLSHVHNLQLLQILITVKFSNDQTVVVIQLGSVTIHHVAIVITDVLYIPSFNFNLLSISKLSTEINKNIYSFPHECLMQDQRQKKGWVLGKL